MSNLLNQHEACVNWAKSILTNGNAAIVETIAETPYSYVVKISIDNAVYYLKKTPPNLFIESKILELIKYYYPEAAIPLLVAINQSEYCFLLKSCGDHTLRKYFAGTLNIDLLVKGIQSYRLIQEKLFPHIEKFINIGIPDWRLSRLPRLYSDLVNNEIQLKKWGFSHTECHALAEKKETFAHLCKKIESLDIPDALNHSDFQENNMLLNLIDGKVSIIDWGEVTIGHPLLPIIGCFERNIRLYKVDPTSDDYKKLQHKLFAGWGIDKNILPDIHVSLSAIGDIYYALTLVELMNNTNHASPEWISRIKMGCLSFINTCNRI